MAQSTEKLKIPGETPESTTTPSFASPNIQTAADVKTSQAVAGNSPQPAAAAIPNASQTAAPAAASPTTPSAGAATATPAAATPAATPTVPTTTVPTTTGAPPGVPNTAATTPLAPTGGLPPTPKSIEGQGANLAELTTAQNKNAMDLYNAALAYNGGPTGALEREQEATKVGLQKSTAARGSAGTINSSLYGEDKGRIATNEATVDTEAYNTYQQAVTGANTELQKAQEAFERGTVQEKREMEQAARERQPTEPIYPATPTATPAAATPVPSAVSSVPTARVQAGPRLAAQGAYGPTLQSIKQRRGW